MARLICPCTKDCPERTTTCRSNCEEFIAYDLARVKRAEDAAKRGTYTPRSTMTYGAHKRRINNIKHKKRMEQGGL